MNQEFEESSNDSFTKIISWMINTKIASQLLMLFLFIGGLVCAFRTPKEIHPELTSDEISVEIKYPGASAEEVEQRVLLAVEDNIRGLAGLRNTFSNAYEGHAHVRLELLPTADSLRILQEVKSAVDRISNFPAEVEKPVIELNQRRERVLTLIVYGRQEYSALRGLAERIEDELGSKPEVGEVKIGNAPEHEISIEVPIATLRSLRLSLDQIANTIKESAVNFPAGEILAKDGRILLSTRERRLYGQEFSDILVSASRDGAIVKLGDIATIRDGFEDSVVDSYFNDLPAISIDVFRGDGVSPQLLSRAVSQYVASLKQEIPQNTNVQIWDDASRDFEARIRLLQIDAIVGLILVILLLGMFLEVRLAFWVTLCIPVTTLGSFLVLRFTDFTINTLSMFAFLVALGIIIDYAVVVGENIYKKREEGLEFIDAAVHGTGEMVVPIILAVTGNCLGFLPLLFIPDSVGDAFGQITKIALAVFTIALMEVLLILPARLAYKPSPMALFDLLNRPKITVRGYYVRLLAHGVVPFVNFALRYRYITIALALALFFVSTTLMIGGFVPFSFSSNADSAMVSLQAELPYGTSKEDSLKFGLKLVDATKHTISEFGENNTDGIFVGVGAPIVSQGRVSELGSHFVGVSVGLGGNGARNYSASDFLEHWRKNTKQLADEARLAFSGLGRSAELEVNLSHNSNETLETAANLLFDELSTYRGVIDASNGISHGKRQLTMRLSPQAQSLGISPYMLGQQVRTAFYGSEALREQRGRNLTKVMVRLPLSERSTTETLQSFIIRSPSGAEIFLAQAASFGKTDSYFGIQRLNGNRMLTVSANVNSRESNVNDITQVISEEVLPRISAKYPGLSITLGGTQETQKKVISSLTNGFIVSLLLIYTVLAITFQSYVQPLIVMFSIPFGIIGAVIGHILLGYDFDLMSLLGVAALSGVVLNSALLMVITANSLRRKGFTPLAAIRQAEIARFRPILLTALATFLGVAPLIFETSVAARTLVPMAVSIGFGILFTTLISLALVPSLYLVVEDIKDAFRKAGG